MEKDFNKLDYIMEYISKNWRYIKEEELLDLIDNSYNLGYTECENVNLKNNNKYDEGKEDGYAEGREDGYAEGREDGYAEGKEDGYDEGKEDGYDEGKEDGYNERKNEERNE